MKAETLPRKVLTLFGDFVDPPKPSTYKKKYIPKNRNKGPRQKDLSLFGNQDENKEEELIALKELDEAYVKKFKLMSSFASKLDLNITLGDESNSLPKLYIDHPLFKPKAVEARWYSLAVASQVGEKNSLIILPTGLGKTYIFFLLLPHRLNIEPKKKILVLCPTRPLCQQHHGTLKEVMPNVKNGIIYGQTNKNKRLSVWNDNDVIIATPQTILAELKKKSGVGLPNDLKLIVFDEIHHAAGKHAYAELAEYYVKNNPDCQIINLTASPDHNFETIQRWQKLLHVDNKHVLVRTFDSTDVKDYVYYRFIKAVYLDRGLTDLQKQFKVELIDLLDKLFNKISRQLKVSIADMAYRNDDKKVAGLNFKDLKLLQAGLFKLTSNHLKADKAYELLSQCALLIAFNHAVSVNNKGLSELSKYLQRVYQNYSKDKKRFQSLFCNNKTIQSIAIRLAQERLWTSPWPKIISREGPEKTSNTKSWQQALEDNKLPQLKKIINDSKSRQFLIFANTRDTLWKINYYLKNNLPSKRIGVLTGTSSKLNDPGMTQKEQIETLNQFRQENIDILVSTSVGEEGLDFPAVDVVIFYEPVDDIRRHIQRLGRTARHRNGTVHILIFKDTEEENIYYTSKSREKSVREIIKTYQILTG